MVGHSNRLHRVGLLWAVGQVLVFVCSEIVRLVTLVVIPAPQGGFMRANKTEQWA
jgi:hypothetical protein